MTATVKQLNEKKTKKDGNMGKERIKAIETRYKGYRFRSRLEAKWAVFFNTLGVKWEYEKEGFLLKNGEKYLPDFWLPEMNIWVEIKGIFSDYMINSMYGDITPYIDDISISGVLFFREIFSHFTNSPEIISAFNAAKSARFEFGENGLPAEK